MAENKVKYYVRIDDKFVEADMKDAEKTVSSSGGKLVNAGKKVAAGVGAAFAAVGTATAGIGIAAVNSATDMDKAMNQFAASMGMSKDAAAEYQDVLEGIYANNYGEDFDDIASAMADVTKQLGELDNASLQTVTESAFALRDTFGYEIPESTRAAKAMMDNFGISGEEAMSLIAAGAQNGLDYSGELIDSINEYSVQFSKLGLDADDMFSIFQKGADAGAWNLDKIGDAVKEMSIRVIDGSDTTAEGFATIGLNADKMSKKFAAGGETAKKAFNETIRGLADMKDPIAQNAAGVALFGTMWEDLGPEVVTQLADITGGSYDAANAMEGIKSVKYDDLSSMLEGAKRSLELLLIPLGESLIPLLTTVIEALLPSIESVLPIILDSVESFLPPMLELVEALLPPLLGLFESLTPVIGDLMGNLMPVLVSLFNQLLPPVTKIISELLPPLLELFNALLPIISTLLGLLDPVISLFETLLVPIADLMELALTPLIRLISELVQIAILPLKNHLNVLGSVFGDIFASIAGTVSKRLNAVISIFRNLISFIKNVFTGNWRGAWDNVKNIFKSIWDAIKESVKFPINFIIDGINKFINGINKIEVPEWVPLVGGKGFHIPKIPRLKVGLDYVPSDWYPAYLDRGERVLTAEENAQYTALGGLYGMMNAIAPRDTAAPPVFYIYLAGDAIMDSRRVGNLVLRSIDSVVKSNGG